MKFKTKSAPKLVDALERGRSLAEQITAAREAAEEYVQAEVSRIKATDDAKALPRDWIFLNQYAVAGADRGRCPCRCALSILSSKDEGNE